MAVIGKLRSYSIGLALVIALALIFFLMEDIIRNFNLYRQDSSSNVGVVNGVKIKRDLYDQKIKDLEAIQSQNGQKTLTEKETHDVANQVWYGELSKIVLNKLYANLGIKVTGKELADLLTSPEFVNEQIKTAPIFMNESGQFDPDKVKLYIKGLDNDDPGTAPGTRRKQWLNYEKGLKEERQKSKINALISKSSFVPNWMIEMDYVSANKMIDANYVLVPYTTINDKDVKKEDKEMQAYYEKNKKKYENYRDSRKFKYHVINIFPSAEDSIKLLTKINEIKDEFIRAPNDSIFLKAYSEGYEGYYFRESEIQSMMKDTLLKLPKGTYLGPYIENDRYSISKIIDKKSITDSVEVRIISIAINDIKTEADRDKKIKFIDSIYNAIDSGKANFANMAMMFSIDKNSAINGGNIGWINKSSNEWNPDIFNRGAVGKVFKSQGKEDLKIVQITNYPGSIPAVKFGVISIPLVASSETQNSIYSQAAEFLAKSPDAKAMEAYAKTKNINLMEAEIGKDDFSFGGFSESAQSVSRWVFNNKKETVSPILTMGTKKYIVAAITAVKIKGASNYDDVKAQIDGEFINEVKFKMIKEKMGTIKSLADASKAYGIMPASVSGLNFASPNFNNNYEGSIIGALVNLKVNEVTKPLKGNSGVYVIQPTMISKVETKNADMNQAKMQLTQKIKYKQGYLESMIQDAEIEDNRIIGN